MSQWREWRAWVAIRGPIGGPRQDFCTSFLAMHASGPYEKAPKFADFAMPWAPPEQADDEDDDDEDEG